METIMASRRMTCQEGHEKHLHFKYVNLLLQVAPMKCKVFNWH